VYHTWVEKTFELNYNNYLTNLSVTIRLQKVERDVGHLKKFAV